MKAKLKPLNQQVIVLTGATSGIGLVTARKAAKAGARLVLAARNEEALMQTAEAIRAAGGQAEYVVADVGEELDVARIAEMAVQIYGGFDTWVNNAGAAVYATLAETPVKDHMRVFQTNYFGTVFGSLAAIAQFRTREGGGALINLGSIASDMGNPILGAYGAAKHAVKGFTNTLRMEMIHDKTPVSITLIKPSAIDTPFAIHARNLMEHEAKLPPPTYTPNVVADAILYAAQNPIRDLTVGGVGRNMTLVAQWLPAFADRITPAIMYPGLRDKTHPKTTEDNLHGPAEDGRTRGRDKFARPFSLYNTARTHPRAAAAAGVAAFTLIAAGVARRRRAAGALRALG